jgi:S-(hydroxymethyl)glutathione synthase
MYGRVENPDHHFFGLDFIHIELSKDDGWPPIQFAGFVSSIVESGANPSELNDIRNQLSNLGLESYDEFSPELNAYIASRASDLSFKNQVF